MSEGSSHRASSSGSTAGGDAVQYEAIRHKDAASDHDTAETSPERRELEKSQDEPTPPVPTMIRRNTSDLMKYEQRRELQRLVSTYSRRNTISSGERPETIKEDPALDPESKDFDLEKCLRFFLRQQREQGVTPERSGVIWKNLNVYGTGAALQLQRTVGDVLLSPLRAGEHFSLGKKKHKQILHGFNGVLRSGELLVVLGRPGSGCSTLLKTIFGETHGLIIGDDSTIHYNGIPQPKMVKEFKGEIMYNQEVDTHFPHLTVGQTLEFAASVRTPHHRAPGVSREDFCQHVVQVVMAICGLTHTYTTKVGNEYIRGVSGGERKRVSIAEMILAGSPLSAWDNSTRGLDSATALHFVETLRIAADLADSTNAVAIYQASQAIYDLFDKVTLLYEGHQIYFGPVREAKAFFERQGWFCPPRQSTGDFLTSLTNPHERRAAEGMDDKVPRTAEDFERYWRESPEFEALQAEMARYEEEFPLDDHGATATQLQQQKNYRQAKHVRPKSPFTISIPMQIRLNTKRAYQRIWNDRSATISIITMNIILSLIFGSLYYGTPDTTDGMASKASVLFVAILLNALTAISEINSQYAQRPIVMKQASYAFYHPTTEAIASIASIIPIKFLTACAFNPILYFLSGLRREPSQFFLYFMVTFICTFVMSSIFRTVAAMTKTVSQAMAIAAVCVLALVVYTGFAIAVPQMHPWFSWIRWINPIYYGFEILVANEFHGRDFTCPVADYIPPYSPPVGDSWICSSVGAVAGQSSVSGDAYISAKYGYSYAHVWRNFGILIAFLVFFMTLYFIAVNFHATSSTAEVLVFRRGKVPAYLQRQGEDSVVRPDDKVESAAPGEVDETNQLEPQKDIFTWKNVIYDIKVQGKDRRLLDHVTGWVKPGTLTALMGVSGAGKTTLLDVLAQRTSVGIVTGDMFVNGKPLDPSFQRKTGYVQQQDLHLATATVRESLRFSALLRQPPSVSKKEKYEFVEQVIKMLNMEDFADAVVGVPGEGLNVEQRKLLTIGVELAAKPKLLLFLDEPTSGLDSQGAWAICSFLRKITDAGQALLCTIHQPSALLFQEFDRLLFLARGGRTVYFGDIGKNSRSVLDYFEANGGRKCDDAENPAEYMLEVVNQGTNSQGEDWHEVWKKSAQAQAVSDEVEAICKEKKEEQSSSTTESNDEFAMPFLTQLQAVTYRVFQQYWRLPTYVIPKWMLGLSAGLFIGFTFYKANNSEAGNENVIYSVFLITTLFSNVVQQIVPNYMTRRSLYEVRERPSKAYSWKAFIISSILVEIPYQVITSILIFACFYFPVVGIQSSDRQILILLFTCQLFIYACTFAHMFAAMPNAQSAAAIVVLLNMMSVCFSGVLQPPSALPGFWIFMYRVSPFTYWIGGIVATELHGRPIDCSASETSTFNPPNGTTCGAYLQKYLALAPGQLQNPNATEQCRYCALTTADQFLESSQIYWDERWRNFGIMWAYILFNVFVAVLTYYIFRVKKWNVGARKDKKCKTETTVVALTPAVEQSGEGAVEKS